MNVFKFMQVLSCDTRAKILAHFWSCNCHNNNVEKLVRKIHTTQANVSKHLKKLRDQNLIFFQGKNKDHFYELNRQVFTPYEEIFLLFIQKAHLESYFCTCNLGGHQDDCHQEKKC